MAYITFSEYADIYGAIDAHDFSRYAWEASRLMDIHTTGVDGVKKLSEAMPTDEGDQECVKRCCAALINVMAEIEKTERSITGFTTRADGTVVSKAVSSISSGSESITFANGVSTALSAAVSDSAAREKMYADTVKKYLSGVTDSNGVNLLYMGAYPYVL